MSRMRRLARASVFAASSVFGMRTVNAAESVAQHSALAEERIAVIVGAGAGLPGETPLRYAEADARAFREVLLQLGQTRPERAMLVIGGTPALVVQALNEARGRVAAIAKTGRRTALLFYFSGHGDEEALHLRGGRLPLAELRRAIERVPADLKLSVIDSCRNLGELKGVSRSSGFSIGVTPGTPHGTVELRSSSLGESAQESDELGSAVFTHSLLSALRGAADSDNDGNITLSEAYTYAYRRTLLRTGKTPVLQHPTLALQIAGAGEVVLTRLSLGSAILDLPPGADRYLVFALPSASVVGELSGDGASRIAVPTGRLLVVRHVRADIGVANVDVSWGGERRLEPRDFQRISPDELARRGGQIELRPFRLESRAGFDFTPGRARESGERVGLSLSRAAGIMELEIDGAFTTGSLHTAASDGSEWAVTGGPSLGLRAFLPPVTVTASAGVELRYSTQRLRRNDASREQAAGLPADEKRTYGSFGPKVGLRVAIPVSDDISAALGGGAAGMFLREARASGDAVRPTALLYATLGVGLAF